MRGSERRKAQQRLRWAGKLEEPVGKTQGSRLVGCLHLVSKQAYGHTARWQWGLEGVSPPPPQPQSVCSTLGRHVVRALSDDSGQGRLKKGGEVPSSCSSCVLGRERRAVVLSQGHCHDWRCSGGLAMGIRKPPFVNSTPSLGRRWPGVRVPCLGPGESRGK